MMLQSCKTPYLTTIEETRQTVEETSTNAEISSLDDTTTIRHSVLNDSTIETKIIRRIIFEDHKTARNLQDSSTTESKTVKDTLTPELMKKLLKGLKWTCVAAICIALVFLFSFTLIVLVLAKRR